jgi:hypothetical protein
LLSTSVVVRVVLVIGHPGESEDRIVRAHDGPL